MSLPRRTFLELAALGIPLGGATKPVLPAPRRAAEQSADLVIIGAGLGGCAAALAACRAGLHVICTEATDWIGGQVTSQAVPPDEHPWIESVGCTRSYREFRDGVRAYYRRHYPLTPAARSTARLNPGNGSVSRLCHEPRVALAVLHELLAPFVSARQLHLLLEHVPTVADVSGDRVRAVTVRDLRTGRETVAAGTYFIDATELGDLLPLTNTEFVIGAESQKDTGEPHAPTVAQPLNQQAFTWCFAVDHLAGEDHTIEKPADYAFWRDYVPQMQPPWPGRLLGWAMSDPITLATRSVSFDPIGAAGEGLNLFEYRRIADPANFREGTYPSGISLVNWPQNDYWLGPLLGVDAGVAAAHLARGKDLSLSLLYWMQTEAPRPEGGAGWKGLRLRDDVVATADGLAKAVYVRESRRIKAEVTVTELHVGTDARVATTGVARADVGAAPFPDSVGVGAYRIDLHPSSSGVNYVDISSLPFQIPLGALIPQRVENLIPACKNIGTTHLTNGCYRLHPVEWNIGEAAGLLVAQAIAVREPPRRIRSNSKALATYQDVLRRNGLELEWPRLRAL